MKIVRESSLLEYATEFWKKQSAKKDPRDPPAFEAIEKGESPISVLARCYRSKLPSEENKYIDVAVLDSPSEIHSLILYDSPAKDCWMQCRNLVPDPFSPRIDRLAATFLERPRLPSFDYGALQKNFERWKSLNTLDGAISSQEHPLIEESSDGAFAVIEGFGRFLPFSALLQSGLQFVPVECFVAFRKRQT
jgi:hypothetical protein